MMKNKKGNGFTLIELLAVIIILGVLMLLAVPMVSESILESRNKVYISNAKAIINAASLQINDLSLGVMPKDDIAIIIPLEKISLEKGKFESPFGSYELDKSYVIATKKYEKPVYYITLVDSSGRALYAIKESELDASDITMNTTHHIKSMTAIKEGGGAARYDYPDFRFKYVSHTENVISIKILYKVYERLSEIDLLDGSKWFVISYNDSDEDKYINLLSYDKIVENPVAKVDDLPGYNSNIEEYRNRLIDGGVDLKNAITRVPTFEDICPGKTLAGYVDTTTCISGLNYSNAILINNLEGDHSIIGGETKTHSRGEANGEVHLFLKIEKAFIKGDEE